MKIAISGLSGCGNSTACKNVAAALGIKILNYTLRDTARELGITLDEIQKLAEKDAYYDYLVDKKQIELSEEEENFVIGSRLAGWVIENTDLRVWLTASPEVRAQRIAKREGISFEKALDHLKKRDEQNSERYKKYYGVDVNDLGGYDLILNTEYLTPEQVASAIVEAARKAEQNTLHKPNKIAQRIKQLIYLELEKREKQVKK